MNLLKSVLHRLFRFRSLQQPSHKKIGRKTSKILKGRDNQSVHVQHEKRKFTMAVKEMRSEVKQTTRNTQKIQRTTTYFIAQAMGGLS